MVASVDDLERFVSRALGLPSLNLSSPTFDLLDAY